MNLNDTGAQLLYSTAPIWVEHSNGSRISATSFIVNKTSKLGTIPFLVTNKHIVQDAKKIVTRVAIMENNMPCKENEGINIELNISDLSFDNEFDICAIPIGQVLNSLQQNKISIFYKAITDDIIPNEETINKLSAIEDIIFIGYPSGLYDEENLSPIIRQGLTATPVWNDFQKQPKFIIDAGVFPGSSGSPVFIFNRGTYFSEGNISIGTRLIFLGILTESLLRQELNNANVYLNLGQVIKSGVINKFLNSIVKKFDS